MRECRKSYSTHHHHHQQQRITTIKIHAKNSFFFVRDTRKERKSALTTDRIDCTSIVCVCRCQSFFIHPAFDSPNNTRLCQSNAGSNANCGTEKETKIITFTCPLWKLYWYIVYECITAASRDCVRCVHVMGIGQRATAPQYAGFVTAGQHWFYNRSYIKYVYLACTWIREYIWIHSAA